MDNSQNKIKKNSDARIRANNKYSRSHYKNVSIKIKPDEAEYIRDTAKKYGLSIARLILQAVRVFDDTQEQDINVEPIEKQ